MLTLAGILVVLSPAVLVALFGLSTLLRAPVAETVYSRCTAASVCTGLAAAVWILGAMLITEASTRIPLAESSTLGRVPIAATS